MTVALTLLYALVLATTVSNMIYLRARRRRSITPRVYPSVTIAIPARNEERNLLTLIPSLLAQEYERFDVIVYDDASEDQTAAIVRQYVSARLRLIEGSGPPPGWVGKVHALYQATRDAKGDLLLFLDADARLKDPRALQRLVSQYLALPPRSVLSGLMELTGGGQLIVSLIPFTLFTLFSLPIAERIKVGFAGVLGGGCWMIARQDYLQYEPHEKHPDEVLEDLVIARFLKRQGVNPFIRDLQPEVEIRMYDSLRDGWVGFRKNSSLMGGGPLGFVMILSIFAGIFLVFPALWWPGIVAVYIAKFASDRFCGFSLMTTVLAPLSFVLAIMITVDSAWGHLSGNVTWKGRKVSRRS